MVSAFDFIPKAVIAKANTVAKDNQNQPSQPTKEEKKLARLSKLRNELLQNPHAVVTDSSEYLEDLYKVNPHLFEGSIDAVIARADTQIFIGELHAATRGPLDAFGRGLKNEGVNPYALADEVLQQIEFVLNRIKTTSPDDWDQNVADSIMIRERKEHAKVGPFQSGFTEHLQDNVSSYFKGKSDFGVMDHYIQRAKAEVTRELSATISDPDIVESLGNFSLPPTYICETSDDKARDRYHHWYETFRKWVRHGTNSGFPFMTKKDGWGEIPESWDDVITGDFTGNAWVHAVRAIPRQFQNVATAHKWGPSVAFQRTIPGGRIDEDVNVTPDTKLPNKLRRVMATPLIEKIVGKPFSAVLLSMFLKTSFGYCYQDPAIYTAEIEHRLNSSDVSIGSDFSAFDQHCGSAVRAVVFDVIHDVLATAIPAHNEYYTPEEINVLLDVLERGYNEAGVWLPYGVVTSKEDQGLYSGFALTTPIGTLWNAIFSKAFAMYLDETSHLRGTVHVTSVTCVGDDGLITFKLSTEAVRQGSTLPMAKVLAEELGVFAGHVGMEMSAAKQDIMWKDFDEYRFDGFVTFCQKSYIGLSGCSVTRPIHPIMRAFPRFVWSDTTKGILEADLIEVANSRPMVTEENLGALSLMHEIEYHPAVGVMIAHLLTYSPGHLDPSRTLDIPGAARAVSQGCSPSRIWDWHATRMLMEAHSILSPYTLNGDFDPSNPRYFENEILDYGRKLVSIERVMRVRLDDGQCSTLLRSAFHLDVNSILTEEQKKLREKTHKNQRNFDLANRMVAIQKKRKVILNEDQVARYLSGVTKISWTKTQMDLMRKGGDANADYTLIIGKPVEDFDDRLAARTVNDAVEMLFGLCRDLGITVDTMSWAIDPIAWGLKYLSEVERYGMVLF